ncbi:MAG: ABC-F family ATP-binding cassette domain-containing protein [Bacteroidota bacterium]|nr:ABC-F family ATP-binding cassette domain-containing protein [Bacteroidota bacterium]MDX5506175.1 ABC-F family ATP-binding cassette domain-containing protein [Bacteroidota bacterium]
MAEVINVLSVEGLAKSYGNKVLFRDLQFGIQQGEKVALVAKNGTGKTSLLRILAGTDTPDKGRVVYRKDLRVRYLDQEPRFKEGQGILEIALNGENPMLHAIRNYEIALSHPEDTETMSRCLAEMDRLKAWDFEARVKSILTELQLSDFQQTSETLSGGQVKRLALARVLIEEPDFLILDEPTNHLDLDMIEWLESYLSASSLTLLMVTHDRYFLERVCGTILEMEDGQIFKYDGNYSYFLEKRAERHLNERSQAEKARNLFRRELEWMRSTPQARTTKSKSRIDAFSDLKDQTKLTKRDEAVQLEMRMERLGSKILEIHKLKKAFGDKPIVDQFNYVFKKGDRVGIVGPNGVGKSTFLKMITGQMEPDGGKIIIGETVQFGYYGQEGLKAPEDKRVIDVVKDIAEYIPLAKGKSLSAAQMLERFLFEGEDQYNYVGKLSGGEKRRLYLLTVLMANPNFLILDEPTNDLDILTLNVLEDFLLDYPGVVVVVSHDRFFVDKICDHLFLFEGNGRIRDFNGGYSDYREWKKKEEKKAADARQFYRQKEAKKKEGSKEKTKLSFKEKREFENLEIEIQELEQRKQEIEAYFESGSSDAEKLQELSQEMKALIPKLEEKEMRWLELSEYEQ